MTTNLNNWTTIAHNYSGKKQAGVQRPVIITTADNRKWRKVDMQERKETIPLGSDPVFYYFCSL